jgi:hypothetical protein
MIMPTIPEVPKDRKYLHTDRRFYVFRSVVRSMGFTPPFLLKYQKRNHPVLGRPLIPIYKEFKRLCKSGEWRTYDYELFPLDDLQRIVDARKVIPDGTENPTVAQRAAQLNLSPEGLRWRINAGKVAAEPDVVAHQVRAKLKGKVSNHVQFATVQRIKVDEVQKPDPKKQPVPLPECSRRIGIPLATLHTWRRKGASGLTCGLLGKKFQTKPFEGTTSHGHQRGMDGIDPTDLAVLEQRWQEAKCGRIIRDDGTYLSPLTIDDEFELPGSNTPPSMVLANRRHRSSEEIGRPIRSIDGHYLDCNGKLTFGKSYHEADAEALFPRKKPAPPVSAAKSPALSAVPIVEPPARSKRGGRPRDAGTERRLELCYRMHTDGAKYDNVRLALEREFGLKDVPDMDISRDAKRYATRHRLPFSPRS